MNTGLRGARKDTRSSVYITRMSVTSGECCNAKALGNLSWAPSRPVHEMVLESFVLGTAVINNNLNHAIAAEYLLSRTVGLRTMGIRWSEDGFPGRDVQTGGNQGTSLFRLTSGSLAALSFGRRDCCVCVWGLWERGGERGEV